MSTHSELLLAIDAGNSRIKFGLFDRASLAVFQETGVSSDLVPATQPLPRCLESIAVPLADDVPWEKLQAWMSLVADARVTGIVAGTNPDGLRKVLDGWPADCWSPPRVIDDPASLPLEVDLPAPEGAGIDRLLNAVAANAVRPNGRAVMIVDTGTATTVDCVSAAGHFLGGAILPGFELSARALHEYTALLPLLSIDDLDDEIPAALGRNTRDAIHSGLFWGQLGAVKELIARLADEHCNDQSHAESPSILLTGGGASLLSPHLPQARWEPHLALQGLALTVIRSGGG